MKQNFSSINKSKMSNDVAKKICLLLFCCLAKGDEFYNFYIKDVECYENVTIRMICNVNNSRNGITIFKNDLEMAHCRTYPREPYTHCTNINLQDGVANSTVMNDSMIFQIESANTDNLTGKWDCQYGGPNDPSWSILFPNITCPPKSNCADDMMEKKCDVAMDILLMLAPLFASAILTRILLLNDSQKVIRWLCLIGGFIIYLVISSLTIASDPNKDVKIGLTVLCWIIGVILVLVIVIPVIRKKKQRDVPTEGS